MFDHRFRLSCANLCDVRDGKMLLAAMVVYFNVNDDSHTGCPVFWDTDIGNYTELPRWWENFPNILVWEKVCHNRLKQIFATRDISCGGSSSSDFHQSTRQQHTSYSAVPQPVFHSQQQQQFNQHTATTNNFLLESIIAGADYSKVTAAMSPIGARQEQWISSPKNIPQQSSSGVQCASSASNMMLSEDVISVRVNGDSVDLPLSMESMRNLESSAVSAGIHVEVQITQGTDKAQSQEWLQFVRSSTKKDVIVCENASNGQSSFPLRFFKKKITTVTPLCVAVEVSLTPDEAIEVFSQK